MLVSTEIERKYVILMPNVEVLKKYSDYLSTPIEQTYLLSEEGVTHRVRMRKYAYRTVYTETKKIRIDKMSSEEMEREITEEEYLSLLKSRDPERKTVVKTRHSFSVGGQLFEVDVYPEWERSCILETELESRDTRVRMPKEIRVLLEVTGDRRFSNAAMAKAFPKELV